MTRLVRLGDIAVISQGMGMSGRAAGARAGDWQVRAVSVGDIQDDRLLLERAQPIAIRQNVKTEKHLLMPDDLVLTARSSVFKAAIVPPSATRTIADASLNVVRTHEPGLAPYLWWFVTSSRGRKQMEGLMSGTTVRALAAASLVDIVIPLPDDRELYRIASIVEQSERAYVAAIEAAYLRRAIFRDAFIERQHQRTQSAGAGH